MWTKLYTVTIIVVCLSSCAAQRTYDINVEDFIGRTEKALIREYGVPNEVVTISVSEKRLSYTLTDDVNIPAQEMVLGDGFVAPLMVHRRPDLSFSLSCTTDIIVVNGMVKCWSTKGNRCVDR